MEMQREQLESSRGVSKRDRAWGRIHHSSPRLELQGSLLKA